MTEPFLIAHVVRQQPAFDIAEKMRCPICQGVGGHLVPDFETGVVTDYEGSSCDECDGEGFWWIIPTSGHRARPYWSQRLEEVMGVCANEGQLDEGAYISPPPNWPDHYFINSSPAREAPEGPSLLERLGLRKPKAPIARRV